MRNARVAKRYARSLFEAAEQNDALEQVRQSVESFSAAFAQSPPLRALLRNPVIGAERKVAILREIFAQRTHPLFGAFLELVCLKGRENILDQIAEQFVELYNAWAGIVPASVTTAVEFPSDLVPRIEAFIARRFGGRPKLEFSVNPAILGGIVIKSDDIRLDASVAGQLARLRAQLLGAADAIGGSADGTGVQRG